MCVNPDISLENQLEAQRGKFWSLLLCHSTSLLVEGHVLQQLVEESASGSGVIDAFGQLTFAVYETVVLVAMFAVVWGVQLEDSTEQLEE
jgi:hypothetical protein